MLASITIACCQGRWPTSGFYRFLIFFCPFVVVVCLSLIYTWSIFNTLNEVNVLIWAVGAVFLFFVTSNRDDLLKGLVAGAALSALCAVWQLLVLFPALLEIYKEGGYAAMLKDQHVPFSSFLNQNILGGYCASVLPLALYFAFVRNQRLYFVTACLIIVGLLLSVSRLAIAVAIPSCAVVGVLVFRERGIKGVMPMAACVGTAMLLVLLMIYGPHQTVNAVNNGIQSTLEGKIQRSYSEALTLNFRTDIWKTGVKAFTESPLLGYGAGSFVYPYQKHYEGKRYTKVAHGTMIKIAVELGLLGLLCFLWYCSGAVWDFKHFRRDRDTAIIALSALVVFLFGLLDFSFDTAAHVVTFFCLSSVCFGPMASEMVHSKAKMVSLALILPILVSFAYTAKADSSRRFVEDAKTLSDGQTTEEIRRSLVEAVEVMPWNNDASIHLISSLTSSFLEEKDLHGKERLKTDLIGYVQRMETRRDKDAELFFVLGTAKRAMADGIDSCDYMKRALQYHPSSACYALSAAACYAGHGELDRAQSIIESMAAYYENYRKWAYPDGLLVYKMEDLKAEIEYVKGNREQALALIRHNLQSARRDEFVITDWRARQSLSKGVLVGQLEQRVRALETKIAQNERKAAQSVIH
jgi:O-antigen ligase